VHLKEGMQTRVIFSRKSFIDRLVHQGCTLVDEEYKADVIFQHLNDIFCAEGTRPGLQSAAAACGGSLSN
jgi:hypothetical protein